MFIYFSMMYVCTLYSTVLYEVYCVNVMCTGQSKANREYEMNDVYCENVGQTKLVTVQYVSINIHCMYA